MDTRIRIAAWGTACLVVVLAVPPAQAQTIGDPAILESVSVELGTLRTPIAEQVAALVSRTSLAEPGSAPEAAPAAELEQLRSVVELRAGRPAALPPLYYTLMTLEALDVHSTLRGLRTGHHEANPLMSRTAGNAPALATVKGATVAGMALLTERLWKDHPRAAVILLTAVNATLAAVVVNNYRVGTAR